MEESTQVGVSVEQLMQEPAWNGIPREIIVLASALSQVHGRIDVRREARGIHLYMASPIALEKDGPAEMKKRHLAVNAEKHCFLGKYANQRHAGLTTVPGMCMKYRKPYSVQTLLRMKPITERVPEAGTYQNSITVSTNNEAWMVVDPDSGQKIPAPPGETIPLSELGDTHPAVQYLVQRGFDIDKLVDQFGADYCVKEYPENVERRYRRMPMGFNDTPQGRIIFYVYMNGVRMGWQARIIEKVDGDYKSFWHPYASLWVRMEKKDPHTGKYHAIKEVEDDVFEWAPSKYRTSNGAKRNQILMGLDAAVRWNEEHRKGKPKIAVLCEGPLDAGKIMAPGMPLLGKSMSEFQAQIVATRFQRAVYIADKNLAGEQATASVRSVLGRVGVDLAMLSVPEPYGDAGAAPYEVIAEVLKPFLYD